jgi:excisionase family DNA binding protein
LKTLDNLKPIDPRPLVAVPAEHPRESGSNSAIGVAERMLTKADVAEFFQVTARTLDTWMKREKISYYKIGRTVRFRMEDILRDLASRKVA